MLAEPTRRTSAGTDHDRTRAGCRTADLRGHGYCRHRERANRAAAIAARGDRLGTESAVALETYVGHDGCAACDPFSQRTAPGRLHTNLRDDGYHRARS